MRRRLHCPDADRDRLGAYVAHFNARDFDAIRAMIADDVRLELVNRTKHARQDRGVALFRQLFRRWRLASGAGAGRGPSGHPGVRSERAGRAPKYFMLLGWAGDKVATIRDFRYAPYVIEGADYLTYAPGGEAIRSKPQ